MYKNAKLFNEILAFSLGMKGESVPEEISDMPQEYVEQMYSHEMSSLTLQGHVKDGLIGLLDMLTEDVKTLGQEETTRVLYSYHCTQLPPLQFVHTGLPGFSILEEYEKMMDKPGRRNRTNRSQLSVRMSSMVSHSWDSPESLYDERVTRDVSKHPFWSAIGPARSVAHNFKSEVDQFIYQDAIRFIPVMPYLVEKASHWDRLSVRRAMNVIRPGFALAEMVREAQKTEVSRGTTNDV